MTPSLARTVVTLHELPKDRTYLARGLTNALGIHPKVLARAARLLGWHSITIRSTRGRKRFLTTYLAPPGVRLPKRRRRGRPSFYDTIF